MLRIFGLFFMVFLLSACGKDNSGIDISRLSCPETGLIHEAEDMHIYDKNGKEQVYILLQDFVGGCSFENKDKTSVMVGVELSFYAKSNSGLSNIESQDFKYFVTVLSPDNKIITKSVFPVSIEIDKETGIGISTKEIEEEILLNKLEDAGRYKIVFGLQLTKEQFNKNQE